jgi:predicted MFS family arabinose efflux permease
VVYAAIFVVPPLIAPVFVDRLGFSHAQAGLLMTCYLAAYTVSSLPAGVLADRVGSARVVLAGVGMAGAVSLACSLSDSLLVLAGLRVLLGVATGLVYTASIALLRSALTESRMQAGVGALLAALNAGIALAFYVAPLLESALGWRWTFRLAGLACLLSLPFVALARRDERVPPPVASALPGRIGPVLHDRALMGIAGSLFVTLFVLYGILTWIPPFWTEVGGLSDSTLSLAALALALAGIPGSMVAGAAAARLRRPLAVAAAGLLLSLPVAAVALVPDDAVLMTLFATIAAFGSAAASIPLFALPSVVRPAEAATATGLVITAGMAGAMLSTYLGGVLIEIWRYEAALGMFAVAAAVGATVVVPVTARLGTLAQSKAPISHR